MERTVPISPRRRAKTLDWHPEHPFSNSLHTRFVDDERKKHHPNWIPNLSERLSGNRPWRRGDLHPGWNSVPSNTHKVFTWMLRQDSWTTKEKSIILTEYQIWTRDYRATGRGGVAIFIRNGIGSLQNTHKVITWMLRHRNRRRKSQASHNMQHLSRR